MPRATRASRKAADAIKEKTKGKIETKELFKMKRFKEVPPKTNTNNRSKSFVKTEMKRNDNEHSIAVH